MRAFFKTPKRVLNDYPNYITSIDYIDESNLLPLYIHYGDRLIDTVLASDGTRERYYVFPDIDDICVVHAERIQLADDALSDRGIKATAGQVIQEYRRNWHVYACLQFIKSHQNYDQAQLWYPTLTAKEQRKVNKVAARRGIPDLAGSLPLRVVDHDILESALIERWLRLDYTGFGELARIMDRAPSHAFAFAIEQIVKEDVQFINTPKWKAIAFLHVYRLFEVGLDKRIQALRSMMSHFEGQHFTIDPDTTFGRALLFRGCDYVFQNPYVSLDSILVAAQLLSEQPPQRPAGLTDTKWRAVLTEGVKRAVYYHAAIPADLDLTAGAWKEVARRTLRALHRLSVNYSFMVRSEVDMCIQNMNTCMARLGKTRAEATRQMRASLAPRNQAIREQLEAAYPQLSHQAEKPMKAFCIPLPYAACEYAPYEDFVLRVAAVLHREVASSLLV